MKDDIKRIPRQLIEEVFNKGRFEMIEELIAPEFVSHDPALPHDITGPEGAKEIISGYREAFPDIVVTIEDQIAEGDRVMTRWTARGTHKGDLWGMVATGKGATVTGMTIDKIKNGRIVESWDNWDTMGMMQQLGTVATPAQV